MNANTRHTTSTIELIFSPLALVIRCCFSPYILGNVSREPFVPPFIVCKRPITALRNPCGVTLHVFCACARHFRRSIARSSVKMAAGSDLLDEVFFNTEVDEKVVSDLVGSLESELSGHRNPEARSQTVAKHMASSGTGVNANVQQNKRRLAQEVAKAGAGVQGGVIISNTMSQGSAMDASLAESDSSVGHSQGKTVAVSDSIITPLPNHGGKVASSAAQTLNGGSIMNCYNSGSAVSLTGTPLSRSCTSSSNASVAVTVVNNGPGLSKGHASAVMPPSLNSTIIQTSFVNSQNVVTSSHTASLGTEPAISHIVRPSMQTEGSGTALNGPNAGLPFNVNVAGQPTTTAPGMAIQTPPLNNGQSPTSVAVSAWSHIIKAETPKSIIQTAPGAVTNPSFQSAPRTSTPVTVAASPGGIRAIAQQVLAPRHPQTSPNQPNVQNIQLPPGMVLVRSESGQLLMIHQQTLAQMQSQSQSQGVMAPRPATPTSTPPFQITSVQAPGTPILTRQVTPTTIIKQGPPVPTSAPVTTTLQRPPVLQETMDNVKKCKNFLSTLIKLASSGKQSSETAANVKDLVKDLLEGKIEVEDFTNRLYRELNSSPQPYLVPFLKRSLPALRQLTPDSAAFIQHSGLQQQASATTPTTVVLGSPALRPAAPPIRPHLQPVISKQGQTTPMVLQPQQQGAMVRPLRVTPMVTLRGQPPHSHIMLGQPQVQLRQLQTVPVVKPGVLTGSKLSPSAASLATAAQTNKLKEAGGTFRDDDDINDVASMAGVNLSEESARILATNSELVGAVTRSCKDEAFLHTSTLTRRILEIGKKFGVSDLGPEVVNYVSHASQTRLQNLLEKVSEVAQLRNINFKEDSRYEQTSDMRAQLKFFEQLDQMEKQRKEEQEREILMKAAKSRSRQEDPEQLRLKQKAKEMQQQELFQLRQKEANLTALAAIGPRKKRKMEAAAAAAGAEGSGSSPAPSGSGSSGASRQFIRQRITRVNLRDLLFCLENERDTSHSHLLYKGFLK
ncbi:transcription initiation factor TFIID subunit 4 isoform X2 [Coregonus clupeaformis]|uniref:transcription initiation factor TFIID subunit 4 isoform X2 n=1 Tax=Coregonus clupeaformis TaxID=59861 RepID=UPI001BE019FE|nr:transcription initiation factor TFIID subunit 4 isoform X2 [Coregonus clupeaformis]